MFPVLLRVSIASVSLDTVASFFSIDAYWRFREALPLEVVEDAPHHFIDAVDLQVVVLARVHQQVLGSHVTALILHQELVEGHSYICTTKKQEINNKAGTQTTIEFYRQVLINAWSQGLFVTGQVLRLDDKAASSLVQRQGLSVRRRGGDEGHAILGHCAGQRHLLGLG